MRARKKPVSRVVFTKLIKSRAFIDRYSLLYLELIREHINN